MGKKQLVTSGISVLDEVLGGGIGEAEILHVYGPGGVGKTTLALHFAINVARQGFRTFYVNLDGKFPIIRLKQMATNYFSQITPLITVVSPSSFHDQSKFVAQLESTITPDVRLLIFDTIVSLYRKEYRQNLDNVTLNRKLNQQFGMIVSFVKSRPISVIVVNQVRSGLDNKEDFHPVAESITSYWSTCSIRITRTESKGYREFKLSKAQDEDSKTFTLQLQSSGFK